MAELDLTTPLSCFHTQVSKERGSFLFLISYCTNTVVAKGILPYILAELWPPPEEEEWPEECEEEEEEKEEELVTTFSPKKDLTPTVPVGKVENGEGDKKEEGPPFSDLALSCLTLSAREE